MLGDVEFIGRAGREVANAVRRYDPDVIVTAEAKAIAMAYEVARSLGHGRFVVVRKSVKGYMRGGYVTESVKSITTREPPQTLVLTGEDVEFIRGGRRVCLFDDVVSTGSTMRALERLVNRVGGEVVCRACIWREGPPWYTLNDLVFFDYLPIYVSRELYGRFMGESPIGGVVGNE